MGRKVLFFGKCRKPFAKVSIRYCAVYGRFSMKSLLAGLTLSLLPVFAVVAAIWPRTQSTSPAAGPTRTPVVVELFTSEGCSSCPPADELLSRMAEQQPIANAEVIALEEHVDYWNELGWVDPFSSREWTVRQQVYAGVLGNGNAYTPQMVVDGKTEFVGSQSRKAWQAVQQAASQQKAPVTLRLASSPDASTENLSVTIDKLPEIGHRDTAEVWLAITETGLHSAVKRGENAGEDLHHAAVVRSIRKIGEAKAGDQTSFSGDATVTLRAQWKRENLHAVVFVQEKKSRRILGGAAVPVAR